MVALDVEVQRLQIGDVILVDFPDQSAKVEAKVVRPIERTVGTVLATLRVQGRDDFVREWPLDELVTLVRGPSGAARKNRSRRMPPQPR